MLVNCKLHIKRYTHEQLPVISRETKRNVQILVMPKLNDLKMQLCQGFAFAVNTFVMRKSISVDTSLNETSMVKQGFLAIVVQISAIRSNYINEPEVGASDASKSLLPSCIPYLQGHWLSINSEYLRVRINSCKKTLRGSSRWLLRYCCV